MIRRIEYSIGGPAVRMDAADAPNIRARSGEVVYGTNFVYDGRGAISPVRPTTREPFRPEQTNWSRVLETVANDPAANIETAKRASVMSR